MPFKTPPKALNSESQITGEGNPDCQQNLGKDRTSLKFKINEHQFPLAGKIGKFFAYELKNSGNKAIQDIHFKLDIVEGMIESIEYSNPQHIKIDSKGDTFVYATIPLLNPKEIFEVKTTIKANNNYAGAKFESRAVGATATKEEKEALSSNLQRVLYALTIASTVSLLTTSSSIFKLTSLGEKNTSLETKIAKIQKINLEMQEIAEREKKGLPDQPQVIFSILNKAGLSYLIPQLTNSSDQFQNWKTALFLMHSYLLDKKNAKKFLAALDQISKIEPIAPSSKGFVLYLAGKIQALENNEAAAEALFEQCKKETPLMYEHLMAQDPNYDLSAIEKWLEKNYKN